MNRLAKRADPDLTGPKEQTSLGMHCIVPISRVHRIWLFVCKTSRTG